MRKKATRAALSQSPSPKMAREHLGQYLDAVRSSRAVVKIRTGGHVVACLGPTDSAELVLFKQAAEPIKISAIVDGTITFESVIFAGPYLIRRGRTDLALLYAPPELLSKLGEQVPSAKLIDKVSGLLKAVEDLSLIEEDNKRRRMVRQRLGDAIKGRLSLLSSMEHPKLAVFQAEWAELDR